MIVLYTPQTTEIRVCWDELMPVWSIAGG